MKSVRDREILRLISRTKGNLQKRKARSVRRSEEDISAGLGADGAAQRGTDRWVPIRYHRPRVCINIGVSEGSGLRFSLLQSALYYLL